MVQLSEEIAAAVRVKRSEQTSSQEIKPKMVNLDFSKGVNTIKRLHVVSKKIEKSPAQVEEIE
jgi:hypothetical protein